MDYAIIIEAIRALGYHVSIHRMTGGISLDGGPSLLLPAVYIEMHAHDEDAVNVHIARVDGDSPEDEYRCACELARMVGIDLEDG